MTDKSLEGLIIAISISNAPDMVKLGYAPREVDRVLFSVCGALIRAGARIAYGGNLDSQGYTFKIFRHLAKAYTVREAISPFIHFIPEPDFYSSDFQEIHSYLSEASGIVESVAILNGKIAGTLSIVDKSTIGICINSKTNTLTAKDYITAFRGAELSTPKAFTEMRKIVSEQANARVVMGGKMGIKDIPSDHYSGTMPGIIEETIYTMGLGRPAIILGSFGGAARDIAVRLGLMSDQELVARGPQMESYMTAIKSLDRFRTQFSEKAHRKLSEIAELDRAETLGFAIVDFLRNAGKYGIMDGK